MEYSDAARARMRAQAQRFKEGRASGKHVSLTGANAIAEPGQTVVVRILPRWDFVKKAYMTDPKTKVTVKNPAYQPEEAYATGIEHWFSGGADGKRKREWCRRSLNDDELCPLCEAAAAYKGSSDENERALGNDMDGRDIVLYNVILRKSPFGEDNRPAVKILSVSPTLWLSINRSAAGSDTGEDSGFSIGDYTDWENGYDWKIYRPAARKAGVKQESYSAEHAPEKSRLYPVDQAARWKGWQSLLHDLDAEIHGNVKSYAELYKMIYGVEPDTQLAPEAEPEQELGAEDAALTPPGDDLPPDPMDAGDDVGSPGDEGEPDFDLPEASPPAPTRAPASARRPAAPVAPAAPVRKAPPLRPGPARLR